MKPRFLICRLSAIGDCIHTLPVAQRLREEHPECEITWVVQGGAAQLLQGHAAIDRVIRLRRGWLRSPAQVWALRRELRRARYDAALDVQSLLKSAVAARLSGARRRIAFTPPHGREGAPWLATETVRAEREHVVERYLELLRPLGIDPAAAPPRFEIPAPPEAAAAMEAFLDSAALGPFALLNPGAGWPSKVWPAERLAELALRLGTRHSIPSVVLWADAAERRTAEGIVAGSGGHARLAPPTSLLELAALARRAKFFVGSDTGPLHLAAAVGTPCVGLYGPTSPAVCGPHGSGHAVLRGAELPAGLKMRAADDSAMRAITVDQVVAACQSLPSRAAAA